MIDSNTASTAGTITPDAFGGGAASGYTAGTDGLGTDGISGAFRFNPINQDTYTGANLWFPNGTNPMANLVSGAQAPGVFTTGFDFGGANFQPETFGPVVADITAGVLTVSSLPFGGLYAGAFNFALAPDAGTLVVNNLIALNATDYAYRMSWSHLITTAEDATGQFIGFNARWVAEGVASTVPEASTYGMMLAGLGLVGATVARRRRSMR